MIGGNNRRYQPGDLWQVPGYNVRQKVDRELRPEGVLMQHRCEVLEILEIRENIIGKNSVQNLCVRG